MTYANYPSLKNKTVFITGGTSGIGSEFVLQFAMQKAQVAFIGRHEKNGETLCQLVKEKTGHRPLFIAGDVSDVSIMQNAIHETARKLGDINVLINNAANDQRHETLAVSEAMWQEWMDINLKHQFFTAQAVLPMMIKRKSGSIINIGSNCFMLAEIPTYPVYATAKSAIIGLTRALAREFGKYTIRVNCILPGWVMTQKQIDQWLTPEAEKQTLQEQSLKEKLYPEDISRFALFLAADDSRMITKQSFIIDGGRI